MREIDPEEVFSRSGTGTWWPGTTARTRSAVPGRPGPHGGADRERFEPRGLAGAGRPLYTPGDADAQVRLLLGPDARWVGEYYETEETVERPDGTLEVSMPAGRLEWAERLVLRLSGAEVLGPPS